MFPSTQQHTNTHLVTGIIHLFEQLLFLCVLLRAGIISVIVMCIINKVRDMGANIDWRTQCARYICTCLPYMLYLVQLKTHKSLGAAAVSSFHLRKIGVFERPNVITGAEYT